MPPTTDLTQAILCAMPVRIAMMDAHGNMTMVNEAWKEFNWRNSNITENFDWIGSHYAQLYPNVSGRNAQFVNKIKSGIQSVLSGDQGEFFIEYPYSAEDQTGWFSMNIKAIDHDGRQVVLTHGDIVKQKIAESAIRGFSDPKVDFKNSDSSILTLWADELNQDMSKIVEESLNQIFIFDANSLRFIQANRGARNNLGYTMAELQCMTPLDIKPDYTYDQFVMLIEPLLNKEKEIVVFETRHQRKDRSHYPVEIHLQLSTLRSQSVFVAIILDITESKGINEQLNDLNEILAQKVALRTSELVEFYSRIENIKGSNLIGLWEIDLKIPGKIYRSEEIKELYEVDGPVSDMDSRYFLQFVHKDDRDRITQLMNEAIATGESTKFEFQVNTAKGTMKFLMETIHVLKNSDGHPDKLVGIVCDISDQKKADIKLKMALKMEQETSMLKSRFVAMASHEFRNPLSTILSSTSLIGKYLLTEEQNKRDKHIQRIKSSVQNMTAILNDFLSLEKLESNKVEKSEESIDFNNFLSEIQADTKFLLSSNQKLNVTHIGTPIVQTDPHLLKNILLNLISNAVKYSPDNTDVELISNVSDIDVQIQVKDHGIGIPENEHDQMFSRFFRASNVSSIKGTGLGLTIVKRYLDLLGGEISFDSKNNLGTIFKVRIPIT